MRLRIRINYIFTSVILSCLGFNYQELYKELYNKWIVKRLLTLWLRVNRGFNSLSANLTNWSNTLKQFIGCCCFCLSVFDYFVWLVLKELNWAEKWYCRHFDKSKIGLPNMTDQDDEFNLDRDNHVTNGKNWHLYFHKTMSTIFEACTSN